MFLIRIGNWKYYYRRFLKHGYERDVGSYQLNKRLHRTAKIADVAHVRLWREYVFQKALYFFAYLIFGVTFDVDLLWSKTPELNTFLGEFYSKKVGGTTNNLKIHILIHGPLLLDKFPAPIQRVHPSLQEGWTLSGNRILVIYV